MREDFDQLRCEILTHLAAPQKDFDILARQIFRFQFTHNEPYRAYCDSLDLTPDTVLGWADIPPAPADAFKDGPPLSCVPAEDCGRVFHTSGTTAEVRGRHYLADTALYEASIRQGWQRAALPTSLSPLFLSQPPSAVPASSLAFMFGVLAGSAAQNPASWLLSENGGVKTAPLESAIESGQPILLFSTALALRHLFEQISPHCPLPPGSWVFQTGGYKGLDRTYDPLDLYRAIEEHLQVPAERVINEYGMTELSSASYALGLNAPHLTPPWLRVRTIHPETNLPNPPGQAGHLVFCDLANLNSVVAVRTADLGTTLDDHTFFLEGRDPSASPRGCSRASDAFLQRP